MNVLVCGEEANLQIWFKQEQNRIRPDITSTQFKMSNCCHFTAAFCCLATWKSNSPYMLGQTWSASQHFTHKSQGLQWPRWSFHCRTAQLLFRSDEDDRNIRMTSKLPKTHKQTPLKNKLPGFSGRTTRDVIPDYSFLLMLHLKNPLEMFFLLDKTCIHPAGPQMCKTDKIKMYIYISVFLSTIHSRRCADVHFQTCIVTLMQTPKFKYLWNIFSAIKWPRTRGKK